MGFITSDPRPYALNNAARHDYHQQEIDDKRILYQFYKKVTHFTYVFVGGSKVEKKRHIDQYPPEQYYKNKESKGFLGKNLYFLYKSLERD